MIKLIEFKLSGHPLFQDDTLFSIQATGQNNSANRSRVIDYGDALYLNKTIGVVGINAAGKSTLLNLFDGLSAFYLEDRSIDQTALQESLRGNQAITVKAHLADNLGTRYLVQTTFKQLSLSNWVVADELIYKKHLGKSARKRDQFSFQATQLVQRRSELSADVKAMLSPKDSAFRAYKDDVAVSSTISMVSVVDTNRAMTFMDSTPIKLLQYLDDSIESLSYSHDEKTGKIINVRLKFKNQAEVLNAATFEEITTYLSSGTVRGMTLFYEITNALRTGATLLIDELELHINKRIVEDFIAFFQNPKINVANATLIYSTHYIELIDHSERKDENYFLARQAKTAVCRYSDIPDLRGDIKKSDIFKSNFIGGTAPSYDRLDELNKELATNIANERQ